MPRTFWYCLWTSGEGQSNMHRQSSTWHIKDTSLPGGIFWKPNSMYPKFHTGTGHHITLSCQPIALLSSTGGWVPLQGSSKEWNTASDHQGFTKTWALSLEENSEGNVLAQSARQELLWRQFFLDPTLWWDNRHDKQTSRSPDFKHKVTRQVLWLNSVYKPAWVESQLARLDRLLKVRAPCAGTVEACIKFCEKGQLAEAVDALEILGQTGSSAPISLFYSILKGLLPHKNLTLGRRVHALAVKCGHQSNAFLANHILRMYSSHGRLQEAMEVFGNVAVPNIFMWFSIISACAEHGQPTQAIRLYQQMLQSTVMPNNHIFAAALKACAAAGDLESGRQVHAEVLERGIVPDVFLVSCLVDMYAKCGSLEDARRVFDGSPTRNVVTWTAMVAGYADQGLGQEALALYAKMEQEGIVLANSVMFSCLLKACMSIGALQQGTYLHQQIAARGLETDVVVGSCLVDMYSKCGSLEDARRVFDSLPTRDVITWTSMIAAYADHGLGQEALSLYAKMECEGMVFPNNLTFASLLKACTSIGAIQQGKQLHAQIQERKLEADKVVGSCLVDMYAQCGCLEDALRVFDGLAKKDVITWTVMVNGFGQSNEGQRAIQCFQEMLQNGVRPDESTFICLLVACSHKGLVEEGRHYFCSMMEDHGILPNRQHYVCMADILGRSGHLEEAEKILLSMPFDIDDVGWSSLLNACKIYGDLDRGRRCFENLIRLDPQNASSYMLMANLYADAGRWTDVDRIESLRKSVGASKKAARAGVEVNNQVHTFVVGEKNNGLSPKLRNMNVRLKDEGCHVPHTELVLKPVSDKEKEDDLCGHAEKLALAYGLLNTPDGTSLLVTKNLRMCSDCHSATQIMSRIEKREIIVRDAHQVHRFVEGSCSCGDRP